MPEIVKGFHANIIIIEAFFRTSFISIFHYHCSAHLLSSYHIVLVCYCNDNNIIFVRHFIVVNIDQVFLFFSLFFYRRFIFDRSVIYMFFLFLCSYYMFLFILRIRFISIVDCRVLRTNV